MIARVGFVQTNPILGKEVTNVRRLCSLLETAPPSDLIVGCELALTGYTFESPAERDNAYLQQEQTNWLTQLTAVARKKDTALCVGFLEKEGEHYYNSAIFLTPEGKKVVYRKTHLFFREPQLFEPGNGFPLIVNWRSVRYGLGICLDYLFPEYWRLLSLNGVDVFCLPANLVTDNGHPLMNARSRENRTYSIVANRSGVERTISFRGRSQVNAPDGDVLSEATREEDVRVVELDMALARDKYLLHYGGIGYNHVLAGRRPERYVQIQEESL